MPFPVRARDSDTKDMMARRSCGSFGVTAAIMRAPLARRNTRKRIHLGTNRDTDVRTASDLRSVLEANPFPDAQPEKIAVVFQSGPLPEGLLDNLVIPGGEEIRPGKREIYIHYPDGMGRSKLRLPSLMGTATARNINTVAKLVAMTTA